MTARRRRPITAAALALLAMLMGGCGQGGDPSAPYFPTQPAPTTGSGVTAGNARPASPLLGVHGKVSRPRPELTPGAIALTDVNKVCLVPKRFTVALSAADQQGIFTEYGIPALQVKRYKLDYLVPLQLGGAATLANVWPAKMLGTGYQQKQQLNYRLQKLVCQGDVSLAHAQQLIASDWYAAWLQYAAGG